MGSSEDALRDALDALMTAAEQAYRGQTGGINVCQLQKDGRVTGGMKYVEGQLVTLTLLRRRLAGADGGNTRSAFGAAITDDLAVWRAALQAQQRRTPPSVPWVAYCQGGVDALEQVLALAMGTP
ncbi:MAG: hypothetical protein WCI67_21310 [Chloroflexales bacterium]